VVDGRAVARQKWSRIGRNLSIGAVLNRDETVARDYVKRAGDRYYSRWRRYRLLARARVHPKMTNGHVTAAWDGSCASSQSTGVPEHEQQEVLCATLAHRDTSFADVDWEARLSC
jgi:hypothetical protein